MVILTETGEFINCYNFRSWLPCMGLWKNRKWFSFSVLFLNDYYHSGIEEMSSTNSKVSSKVRIRHFRWFSSEIEKPVMAVESGFRGSFKNPIICSDLTLNTSPPNVYLLKVCLSSDRNLAATPHFFLWRKRLWFLKRIICKQAPNSGRPLGTNA